MSIGMNQIYGGGGAAGGNQRERVYYPQACVRLKLRLEDFARGEGKGRLEEYYDFTVMAKRTTVTINEYTQADQFEVEIDYKSFPFDPRAIRSAYVSIHAEDMIRNYDSQQGTRPKITPREDNAIFLGFADEEGITFNESDRMVKFEGRDNTCLFIDEKYPKGTVDVTKTVDQILANILKEQPATANLRVDNRVGKLPVLASFYETKQEGSGRKNVKRDQTYWDVIQDICREAGVLAYIELDRLVLTRPRTLYDKAQAKVFIYGHNIKDLKFTRKIGRRKGFNLIVRALSFTGKQVIEAKIPLEATAAWSKETGFPRVELKVPEVDATGKPVEPAKPAPYIAVSITKVANKQRLIEVGQEIYEEIGRQQIEGSFGTKDMQVSFQKLDDKGLPTKEKETFDVLQLRNGTPVAVVIDQGDLKDISNLASTDERRSALIARGYDPTVAQIFAQTLGRYSNIFFTKSCKFTFDSEDGFSMDLQFLNFIEVPKRLAGG